MRILLRAILKAFAAFSRKKEQGQFNEVSWEGLTTLILIPVFVILAFYVFYRTLKAMSHWLAEVEVTPWDAFKVIFRQTIAIAILGTVILFPAVYFIAPAVTTASSAAAFVTLLYLLALGIYFAASSEAITSVLRLPFVEGMKINAGVQAATVATVVVCVGILIAIPKSTFQGDQAAAVDRAINGPEVPLAPTKNGDWQRGEPIQPAETKGAPIRRHGNAPWFQISNLRRDSADRDNLIVDYKREGKINWNLTFVMVARTPTQKLEFSGIGCPTAVEGQINARQRNIIPEFAREKKQEEPLEVWFELRERWSTGPDRMKVSNSLTLGSIGGTYARHWTHDEQLAFDKFQRGQLPLPPNPNGTEMVTKLSQLVPGLPVLYGYEGQWHPFEVIDVRRKEEKYVLLHGNFGSGVGEATKSLQEVSWESLAVKSSDLQQAAANPSQFRPSVHVLPGGSARIPADLVTVTDATPLVPGTPIKIGVDSRFVDGLVVELRPGGEVSLYAYDYSDPDRVEIPRSRLLISPQILEALKKPDAKERLAVRAELARNGIHAKRLFNEQHYHIEGNIPLTAIVVPPELSLPKGTRVRFSWAQARWENATVLDVNYLDPNLVLIESDHLGSQKHAEFPRDQLIISKFDLAKIPGGDRMAAGLSARSESDSGTTAPSKSGPAETVKTKTPETRSVTQGWFPVLEETPLVIGAPVKAEDVFKKWENATIKEIIDQETVELFFDDSPPLRTETKRRSELMITAKALEALKKPDAVARFASRAEGGSSNQRHHKEYPSSEYSIRLPIPAKAVRVTSETPLQPGVICGMCVDNQWRNVMIDRLEWDGTVVISVPGTSWAHNGKIDRECLIIEKKVLERLKSPPAESQAAKPAAPSKSAGDKSTKGDTSKTAAEMSSVKTSTSKAAEPPLASATPPVSAAPPVFDKLLQVEAETPLMLGVPVKAIDVFKNWSDATVSEMIGNDKVEVIWDRSGLRKEERSRSDLKIRTRVMEALKQPGIDVKFAARLERIQNSIRTYPYPKSEYSIRIPIPPKGVRVTKETPLEPGTQLGMNSRGRWVDVTVIDTNWDDTVRIHVNQAGEHFDGDIDRECLIIDKKVLTQLQAKGVPTGQATPSAEPATAPPSTSVKESPAGRYQVILKSFNLSNKIVVARAVSQGTGIEVKDAMALVAKVPITIKKDLDKEAAEKLRKDVDEAGGTLEVKPQ